MGDEAGFSRAPAEFRITIRLGWGSAPFIFDFGLISAKRRRRRVGTEDQRPAGVIAVTSPGILWLHRVDDRAAVAWAAGGFG